MSYTTLYILNKKSVTEFQTYKNSWGSAIVIWDVLSIKYLGLKNAPIFDSKAMQNLWDLASDPRVSEDERIVHRMTFDYEYVPIANLKRAADACRVFFSQSASMIDGGRVNHWYSIGDDLERMAEAKLNRHARGACLGCTSVSDPWWVKKKIPDAVAIFR